MTEPAVTPEVEHEQDVKPAPSGKRVKTVPNVGLNPYDSTLNAVVDREGAIFGAMTQDGLHHLLAHARANVAIKKGRYYFEVTRLEGSKNIETRFGVSLASAKFAGATGSIVFDLTCGVTINGEAQKALSPHKFLSKTDIAGVLINLEPKHPNKNTISLFINGQRHSQPVPLPDNFVNQPLYPHVAIRCCSIGVNFYNIQAPLPFTVLMLGQAATTDVEKTKVLAPSGTPQAVFPIGTNIDAFVKEFLVKNAHENYLALTPEYLKEWCADSKCHPRQDAYTGIGALDAPNLLAPLLRTRPRNIIFAVGFLLFPDDRKARLAALPGFEKMAVVVPSEKSSQVFAKYLEAAYPTPEEGFSAVRYEIPEEKAVEQLAKWKKDQKLRSKVEEIKVGEYFVERTAEWTKFESEKKLTDEGKEFTDEDWMLAKVRAELTALIHSFKEDVNDEERPSFPTTLATHYYQTYLNPKTLNPLAFACDDMESLITDHLHDCIAVDEETGLLTASLAKDVELEKIFELVDRERDARETRVGAGDELSELKFSAKNPPRPQSQTYVSGKGKGGYKGQKRGGGIINGPPAQRPRF